MILAIDVGNTNIIIGVIDAKNVFVERIHDHHGNRIWNMPWR